MKENELMIFDGVKLELLTNEDVNFKFDGTVLFNGKQVCEILGYSNQNRDIDRHCDEDSIYIITEDKLSTEMVSRLKLNTNLLTLGQRGTKFINEDGIFDLIYNSNLPKAKDFKKKVRSIIKTIQQTGKYDSIEEKIKLIEDEEERVLTLKLYQLNNLLKTSPNDMLIAINYNQTQQQLETYKHTKEIQVLNNKLQLIEESNNKIADDVDMIKKQQVYICNRTNFNERVKILANKYFGRDIQETYKQLFGKMRLLGSFDVFSHRKHEWEALNADREKEGKKPYKVTTLKQKFNYLDVIDKFNKWELCSEAYKTIETEMVN